MWFSTPVWTWFKHSEKRSSSGFRHIYTAFIQDTRFKHISFLLHGALYSFTETDSSTTAFQSPAVMNRPRLEFISAFVCLFVYSLCNAPLRTTATECLLRRVTLPRACAEQNRNTNTVAMATLKGTAASDWSEQVRSWVMMLMDRCSFTEGLRVCACVCVWCLVSRSHEMQVNKENISLLFF